MQAENVKIGSKSGLCKIKLKFSFRNVNSQRIFFYIIIGSCDRIDLSVNVNGGSGGRKLRFAYSVTYSSQNSDTASAQVTAVLAGLNTTLNSIPSNTTRYSVEGNDIFLDVYLTFTVVATNFLGQSASSSLTVLRENKEIPTVIIAARSIETTADQDVILRGKQCKFVIMFLLVIGLFTN